MEDILWLTGEVISLVKDRQLEKAAREVAKAVQVQADTSVVERSGAITQVNLQLSRIKRQREALRQTVQDLPGELRIFAETHIEEIVDQIFSREVANLRATKRNLSRSCDE